MPDEPEHSPTLLWVSEFLAGDGCTLQEAEEPIEDFIDVPSLPASGGEGTMDREARETERGRRPLKRLKRIYQSDTGNNLPPSRQS